MSVPVEAVGTATHATRIGVTRRTALAGSLRGAAAGVLPLASGACGAGQPAGPGEGPAARSVAPAKLVWAYWGNPEQVAVREQVLAAVQQR